MGHGGAAATYTASWELMFDECAPVMCCVIEESLRWVEDS